MIVGICVTTWLTETTRMLKTKIYLYKSQEIAWQLGGDQKKRDTFIPLLV